MMLIQDPDGTIHMLGNITEDNDFTECGEVFTTTRGWIGSARGAKSICVQCLTKASSSTVTIKHNFIGGTS